MERFVDGDEGAFGELYERVSPALHAKLSRTARDPEQARDVVQSTFLKLFRAKDKYERGAAVMPWISVIAKRTLIDEQRPLGARHEVLSRDGQLPEVEPMAAPGPDLHELLRLRQALAQLPESYRDAIELTKVSGMTGSEAASALKTTSAAIKQRVHRGYELLRQLLLPLGDSSPAAS
jgi:RNA polymerase sigma-70 factor (ECF subfamily)